MIRLAARIPQQSIGQARFILPVAASTAVLEPIYVPPPPPPPREAGMATVTKVVLAALGVGALAFVALRGRRKPALAQAQAAPIPMPAAAPAQVARAGGRRRRGRGRETAQRYMIAGMPGLYSAQAVDDLIQRGLVSAQSVIPAERFFGGARERMRSRALRMGSKFPRKTYGQFEFDTEGTARRFAAISRARLPGHVQRIGKRVDVSRSPIRTAERAVTYRVRADDEIGNRRFDEEFTSKADAMAAARREARNQRDVDVEVARIRHGRWDAHVARVTGDLFQRHSEASERGGRPRRAHRPWPEAERMGRDAFAAGLGPAPALNRSFNEWMFRTAGPTPAGSQGSADIMDMMESYARGWTDANLAAPVPGWSDEENEALRAARGAERRRPWSRLPAGWTQASLEKFWDSVGGRVRTCIARIGDRVDSPGGFCAGIADRLEPGWRSKRRAHDAMSAEAKRARRMAA
jgi:hypothetical protein